MIERVRLLAATCHAAFPLPCEGGACRHQHALNSQDMNTACACLGRRAWCMSQKQTCWLLHTMLKPMPCEGGHASPSACTWLHTWHMASMHAQKGLPGCHMPCSSLLACEGERACRSRAGPPLPRSAVRSPVGPGTAPDSLGCLAPGPHVPVLVSMSVGCHCIQGGVCHQPCPAAQVELFRMVKKSSVAANSFRGRSFNRRLAPDAITGGVILRRVYPVCSRHKNEQAGREHAGRCAATA